MLFKRISVKTLVSLQERTNQNIYHLIASSYIPCITELFTECVKSDDGQELIQSVVGEVKAKWFYVLLNKAADRTISHLTPGVIGPTDMIVYRHIFSLDLIVVD